MGSTFVKRSSPSGGDHERVGPTGRVVAMTAEPAFAAVIVGAGPAGLTAAIYLGRFRRRFLVIDGGDSRARWIPISHNHPGFPDGVAGADLVERMRRQAERYGVEESDLPPVVHLRPKRVTSWRGFSVTTTVLNAARQLRVAQG